MKIWISMRRMIVRSSLLVPVLYLSACSLQPTPPPDTPEVPEIVEVPSPEPVPEPPLEEPEPVAKTPPKPAEPAPPSPPRNIEPLVAIVISDSSPAYMDIANALETHLERSVMYDLSSSMQPRAELFGAIQESGAAAVVAIGMSAAAAAEKHSRQPLVVGQVFNLDAAEWSIARVRFVRVLPPIALQAAAWLEIDPELKNVGAIFGPGHEELIEETRAAMQLHNVQFHHVIAETDKQTLYLFNRLIRELDGFMLFPDNRILSRTVLSEMMSAANRHGVQMAVYNEPLLQFGATFNTASVPADVANAMTVILNEIVAGRIDQVPLITPLTMVDVQSNPQVLRRLGLIDSEQSTAAVTQ